VLGPSSGEASLNSLARARALRAELMGYYHDMWAAQPIGLSPASIQDLIDGPRDEAHKVRRHRHALVTQALRHIN
jgi:hypothetical protein